MRLAALLTLSPRVPNVLTLTLTTEGSHDGGEVDIPPPLLALIKIHSMLRENIELTYLCTVRLN